MRSCRLVGLPSSLALLLLHVLSACVSVRHDLSSLEDGHEASMLARVQTVAFPLLLASADWCPFDLEPTYGFVLQDQPASAAKGEIAAGRGIVITQVYARSPAAMAGLHVGDLVLGVNTRDVSKDTADGVMDLVNRLTRARIQPLQLDVARAGRHFRIYLEAMPSCRFTLGVLRTDLINAVSDGRRIAVTTGLMRFVRSDDELAWVLAHEIAHNVLGHVPEARLRAMLNAWLGATIGETMEPHPPPRSLETQADDVGAYLMARAGYDLQAVRHFWQRLRQMELRQTASAQGLERSHPTTEERIEAFEATLKTITDVRARREDLDPMIGPR